MKRIIIWAVFGFQAVLPAVIIFSLAHLVKTPFSKWGWIEWAIATPLAGLLGMTALAAIWNVLLRVHQVFMQRRSVHP